MKFRITFILISVTAVAALAGCVRVRSPDVASAAENPAGGAGGHVRQLDLVTVSRERLPARHSNIWPERDGWRVDGKWCADASQVLGRVRRRSGVAVIRHTKADQTPWEKMNELAWRLKRQGHFRIFYDPDRGSIDSLLVVSEFR
ncbi:MAG: hypothetical protein EOP86_19645 [Verrucomicrobiaceae bacterium]|nr:MAG: hypothetical protein EOP86_19645 [Verrucomicrobiaceae bacterium]